MGEVYRAVDPELGRELAIKVLKPNHAEDLAALERFLREARITGQLEHPSIVPDPRAGAGSGRSDLHRDEAGARRDAGAAIGQLVDPDDRQASGVIGEMDVWENLISEDLRARQISSGGWLISKARAVDRARRQIEAFDVRCEGPFAQTRLLSGGNMQKLILARALSREPVFILANQPVRGLDEGAIAYVQTQLLEARKRGAGILLISEDLDELLSLSDRMAVMFHGRLSAPFAPADHSIRDIGLMMAGQDPAAGQPEAAAHAD